MEKAAASARDGDASALPHPRIHRIDSGDALSPLGQFSKLNPEWSLLQHLRDIGREKAEAWLTRKAAHVGERSTFRL
jgi:NTE family protein